MISIWFARMPKGSLNAHHVKRFHPQSQNFEPVLIQHITSTTWKYSAENVLFESSHNRISSNVRATSSPLLTKEIDFEKCGLWTIKEWSKSKNTILWVVCLLLLFYLYFWWQAGIKKWGTDEEKFIEIFTTRSFAQLRAMLPEYKTVILPEHLLFLCCFLNPRPSACCIAHASLLGMLPGEILAA